MKKDRVAFCLYSIAVEIKGSTAQQIAKSFDYFTHRPAPAICPNYSITLECLSTAPIHGNLSNNSPIKKNSKYTLYRDSSECLIYDYHSQAQLKISRSTNHSYALLTSENPILQNEIACDFLHQELGFFFEEQGFHYLNTFSIGLKSGKAAIFIFDEVQYDFIIELLTREGIYLNSLSHTLIDRKGYAYPLPTQLLFPTRCLLPEKWKKNSVYKEKNKNLIQILASNLAPDHLPSWGNKFAPGWLFIVNNISQTTQYKELSKAQSAIPLWKKLIHNREIPVQATIEPKKLKRFGAVSASRLTAATAIANRYKIIQLETGKNIQEAIHLIFENYFK